MYSTCKCMLCERTAVLYLLGEPHYSILSFTLLAANGTDFAGECEARRDEANEYTFNFILAFTRVF